MKVAEAEKSMRRKVGPAVGMKHTHTSPCGTNMLYSRVGSGQRFSFELVVVSFVFLSLSMQHCRCHFDHLFSSTLCRGGSSSFLRNVMIKSCRRLSLKRVEAVAHPSLVGPAPFSPHISDDLSSRTEAFNLTPG